MCYESGLDFTHLLTNALRHQLRVILGRFDAMVPHNLTQRFYRHAVLQSDGSGERMTDHVEGENFIDISKMSNLFEVGI